jgi:hypothetical protein
MLEIEEIELYYDEQVDIVVKLWEQSDENDEMPLIICIDYYFMLVVYIIIQL